MNITINTLILAAQEIINRYRQIGGALALAQVRHKLYNQMIDEQCSSKSSLETQNFHKSVTPLKMIFVIIDFQLIKVYRCDRVCCKQEKDVIN